MTKFNSLRFSLIFAPPDKGYRKGIFFVNLFPDPSVLPRAGHLPLKKGGAFSFCFYMSLISVFFSPPL